MSATVSRSTLGFVPLLGKYGKGIIFGKIIKHLAIYGLIISLWLGVSPSAWAETAPGLFEVNCAGCHPNGANIIRRGKNLKQKALKRHGYTSVDAIATLITNGKGLMSAYGERLSPDDINALAQYVLDQAAINWKPSN